MRYAFQQRLHKLISRNLELTVASFCLLFRRPLTGLRVGYDACNDNNNNSNNNNNNNNNKELVGPGFKAYSG